MPIAPTPPITLYRLPAGNNSTATTGDPERSTLLAIGCRDDGQTAVADIGGTSEEL